jgi:ubiquinone/menaquinone biosynthesis C-methylase UbiE
MSDLLDRFVYRASQRARFSWYFGQKLLAERMVKPTPTPADLKARLPSTRQLLDDLRGLVARDFANVAAGRYALPPDLADNPITAFKRARAFFRDLRVVDGRRHAERHQEVHETRPDERFPRYYQQNFHYQTDGWLSRESAELYDHQVEVLFMGCADTMRRQALLPLGVEIGRIGQRNARLIDIACGTGRFLREVKANYPRLDVTALDLSPFYLDKAREALSPWSGTHTIAAPAEAVPEPDGAFDLASVIFLFHELPRKAQRQVAAELGRLVKPGGLLVVVDSLQTGDFADYDALLDVFPVKFHEPYYSAYLKEDLVSLFKASGFEFENMERAFLSKIMTFRRVTQALGESP